MASDFKYAGISDLQKYFNRADDFTNYVGVAGYELIKTQKSTDVVLQAADNDSKNLENSIKEKLHLLEFFKDNKLTYNTLKSYLSTATPYQYQLRENAHINTPYINDRVNKQIGLLKGTNYGLYPQSVIKENYTENGEFIKYTNLYLNDKKTQDSIFDSYPFIFSNMESKASFKFCFCENVLDIKGTEMNNSLKGTIGVLY